MKAYVVVIDDEKSGVGWMVGGMVFEVISKISSITRIMESTVTIKHASNEVIYLNGSDVALPFQASPPVTTKA